MSKGDAKKQLILDRGLRVMQSHGYNGTSVKDIVEAAGVPKGSFYNYFESKEAFALDAIDQVASQNIREMTRILSNKSKSAKSRVSEFFEENINGCCVNQFKIGCFLGNMSQEMSDSSEPIRIKLEMVMNTITEHLASAISQMKADGELDHIRDPESLAQFLINSWHGSMLRMKTDSRRQPLDVFMTHLNELFDGGVAAHTN